MTSIIVSTPHRTSVGVCSVCEDFGGVVGASCDVCVRAAYQREIDRALRCELDAIKEHGFRCDLVRMLNGVRSDLLAGLAGHDLIRDILPAARMQAPEVP